MVEDAGGGRRRSGEGPISFVKKYDGPERRAAHRRRLDCLTLIYRRPLLGRLLRSRPRGPCRVSNITSRGMRFYTVKKLKPHLHIEVSFDVPVGVYRLAGENHLTAKVIWQKWSRHRSAWRTGAQFIHVSKTTHTDLARMISDAALHSTSF